MGYDDTPPTCNVLYLSYETDFSDSGFNPLTAFDIIFNQQKNGQYKVSTNSGSRMETITITNTGTIVTLPDLILETMPPIEEDFLGLGEGAFTCQGAKSIKIFLNGEDVTPTGRWLPCLENVDTEQSLSPGDTITVIVHYEFAFKGVRYSDPDVSTWLGEDYVFEAGITSAYGPTWSGCLTGNPVIN
jgi:hypothetical protein